MKYCEDLLEIWDKRIQIEATLLFFFSIVTGSSFLSLGMFYEASNPILYFIPFFYVCTMFCWWHLAKRLAFNTTENNQLMLYTNAFSFLMWQVITAAVCFGGWRDWGWNTEGEGNEYPKTDNLYRFANCLLITAYICTLSYDYFKKISERRRRIRLWCIFILLHAIISLGYFSNWISLGVKESVSGQWFAVIGCVIVIISCLILIFISFIHRYVLITLFSGLILYWWGSSALDCRFYPDTGDMTVMPGYQMLWTMSILVLLEALPTTASDIWVLGAQMLVDDEEFTATINGPHDPIPPRSDINDVRV